MKRTLIALVCLLMVVFSVTTASAAGSWHYCELCGREHSGVACPESCQNDCAENRNGNVHKWYECPEREVSYCIFCGELTEFHTENCCPSGKIVWNDLKGTFRDGEYSYEEGTRIPQYCNYCGFFGYHSDEECLKNPNRTTVAPVVTPEITEAPTITPEPVVTEAPTAIPAPVVTATPVVTTNPTTYVCGHTDTEVVSSRTSYTERTADYCYMAVYQNVTKCKNCGVELGNYESFDCREHNIVNGQCSECGYTVYVPTASATSTVCPHNNVATRRISPVRHTISTSGNKCYVVWENEVYCTDCYAVLRNEPYIKESEHYFQATGVCPNCGMTDTSRKEEVNQTETVQPEATLEPTVEPTNNVVTDNNQTVTENKQSGNDWVTVLLAILIFALLFSIARQTLKDIRRKQRRMRRRQRMEKEEASDKAEASEDEKSEVTEADEEGYFE